MTVNFLKWIKNSLFCVVSYITSLYHSYTGHCTLSETNLKTTICQELTLLTSSGECFSLNWQTFILNVLHFWKWLGHNPEPFYNLVVLWSAHKIPVIGFRVSCRPHTHTQNYNADKHLTAEGQPPAKTSGILRIIQKTGNKKQT
jgi:hypothetical protein